jgi:hypothetical protein
MSEEPFNILIIQKMMKKVLFLFLLLFWGCNKTPQNPKTISKKSDASKIQEKKIAKNPNFRIIHVFVALCDNANQQIIKVPPKIGNGRDLENNLYWGCKFGTKTFLKAQNDWELIQTIPNTCEYILERCIFKHKTADVLLVADAYAGEFIEKCTSNFLQSCAGNFNSSFVLAKDSISCGGNADLLAYVGHDVLMDVFFGRYFNGKPRNQARSNYFGVFK